MKRVKQLLFCLFVLAFGIMSTGCSEAMISDIKVKSTTKANYNIQIGFDDELIELYAQTAETTKSELIKELKAAGAKYSKKTIDGVKYNMFSVSEKNVKISTIEETLSPLYSDICITGNYFYMVYDPDTLASNMEATSTLASVCSLATSSADTSMNLSMYLKTSISFPSKIAATNGKLSSKSKKVTWTIKGTNYTKKKVMYASTKKVKATAKTTSVKNGKTYKAGKKIVVKNTASLAKMTLDGKAIKNGKIIKSKGTHSLTIWSKNGKVQHVKFRVK